LLTILLYYEQFCNIVAIQFFDSAYISSASAFYFSIRLFNRFADILAYLTPNNTRLCISRFLLCPKSGKKNPPAVKLTLGLNWLALRAFFKPYLRRSFSRGSRS
jgi:hypothetical protein